MKIRVLTISHRQPDWVRAGTDDYLRRLPRTFGVEVVEIRPERRLPGRPVARAGMAEAARLLAAVPDGAIVVALDERGAAWSTAQLGARLRQWRDAGRGVAFLIGGADGLADTCRAQAEVCLSLSSHTLPHGLVRILLVEQLYRCATMLQGHPYHR